MIKLNKKLKAFADKLTSLEIKNPLDDFSLSEEDFFNINIGKRGDNLFLGYYSLTGLQIIFEKYNIYKKLEELGFHNIHISINTDDAFKHKLMLKNIEKEREEKLVELVIRRDFVEINMPFDFHRNGEKYETIVIEWMKMQNPRKEFTKSKPQLPGQDYPGLGIGSETIELLILASRRLGLKGIINIPDHFHNALLYSKIFCYENPSDQAKLIALTRDTKKYTLHEVAWAIENEMLIDYTTGKPFKWFISKQVLALEKEWAKLYKSHAFLNEVNKQANRYKYFIKKQY
jgi:hypothetical protein